ncbi:MAG TPA: NAD(P)/FAD-dependent oxidoreductase [Ktedonobacterales bacterium]|nr:NAD(P)/FAD-dependent oxidoreductase [Ktedonobacterales bacterium]
MATITPIDQRPDQSLKRGSRRPRIVIVGAGFGGLTAAQALGGAPADVTVIDHSNHFVFQPLLYQVATAELSPADISAPIRGVLRHKRNIRTLLAEVTSVDPKRRVVIARDPNEGREHAVPYDYLVLATGARESYFGHEQWAEWAPGLKDNVDATRIRRRILLAFETAELEPSPERARTLMTFIVVGGGPTGVELAGAIAELARKAIRRDFRAIDTTQTRVILVEAGPRLLPQFPEELARKAKQALERMGVEVRQGVAVKDVNETGALIGDEWTEAGTVIWAAGVRASSAAAWVGAPTDRAGRAQVKPDLTVPGHSEIYIIGDTASALGKDGRPFPGVAPVAMQQGRYVARALRTRIAAGGASAPIAPFHYFDRGYLATIGRTYAVGLVGPLRLSGLIAWFVWAGVHISYLIGFRNRALVLAQWFWRYLAFQWAARLIAGPTGAREPRGVERRATSASSAR